MLSDLIDSTPRLKEDMGGRRSSPWKAAGTRRTLEETADSINRIHREGEIIISGSERDGKKGRKFRLEIARGERKIPK